MQPAINDEQITSLLPGCQRGESAAVEALYDLYADRLYRYIYARVGDPEIAADLTTELFVRVIRHIAGFRINHRRPAASFSAWIYRIAANLVNDHYRQARRVPEMSSRGAATASPAMPARIARRNNGVVPAAGRAIETLSEEQRLVILAKFGEDEQRRGGGLAGQVEGAVKSLQHRALQALSRLRGWKMAAW